MTGLNSCISRGGARAFSNNACNMERPVGRVLRCLVLYRCGLATNTHCNKRQNLRQRIGADTFRPDMAVRRVLGSLGESGVLFCRKAAVFSSWETRGFRLNSATFTSPFVRLEAAVIGYCSELCPLPVDNRSACGFLLMM